jgi:hypothetical protein
LLAIDRYDFCKRRSLIGTASAAEPGQPTGRRDALDNGAQFSEHPGRDCRIDFDESDHVAWQGNLGKKMRRPVLVQVEPDIKLFGRNGDPATAAVVLMKAELRRAIALAVCWAGL